MQYVQFRRGTRAEYEALSEKDVNDLYVIGGDDDPVSMYVGDEMIQDVISEPIVVTSDFGSYDTGATIDAGTTVAEILKNMLCKELFPTYTAPSASITYSNPPSGNQFVGTTVTIPTLTLSMTRGTFNSQWNQPSPDYNTSDAKISTSTLTGFEGYSTTSVSGNAIESTENVTIEPGTNSFIVNGSYSYDSPTNNPVSNLGNECPDRKWEAGTATAESRTISCFGVYGMYSNAAVDNPSGDGETAVGTSQNASTANLLRKSVYNNVTTGKTFTLKLGFAEMVAGDTTTYREIHLPQNVKIESQYGFGVSKYDADASFNYVGPVTYDDVDISYNKFVYGNESLGANTFEINCKVYSSNQYT